MDWNNHARSFLELDSKIKDYELIDESQAFILKFNNKKTITIKKSPTNKKDWETRIIHLEKIISKYLAKTPIFFCAKDINSNRENILYCRLSVGLYIYAGIPNYKHYVFYSNNNKIIQPKFDYFEDLVKTNKLIDSDKIKLSKNDIDIFSQIVSSCVDDYIKKINVNEHSETKKWFMKYLEQLYYPDYKKHPVLFGFYDKNKTSKLEQSENELIGKKIEIQKMFNKKVILKILSFGYILSSQKLYK
ncbi:MAG: hypothetical protein JXB50_05390 [Spirochaetes bacterium]|nr:hypothetical protein [Spirochaetota bacterium]